MGTVARLTSAGMDLARRIGVPDDETMSRCQLLPVSSTQRRPRLVDPENPRMWARPGASAARRRERSRPWRSRWRTRSAQEPQRLADLPHCWMPNAPDLVADVLPRFGQTRQDYRSRPEVSASVDKRHRRRDGDSTCSTTREPRRRVGLLSDLRTTCGSSRASSGSSSTVRSPRARRAGRSQLGSPRSSIGSSAAFHTQVRQARQARCQPRLRMSRQPSSLRTGHPRNGVHLGEQHQARQPTR